MATARYPSSLITLHWLTVVLVAAAFASMELRGLLPRGSVERGLLRATHYSLGISILLLTVARGVLGWRSRRLRSAEGSPAARWMAALVHLGLYAFLLLMPLSGWLLLSAEGEGIAAWGIPLPALMGTDPAASERFEELHELFATVGYVLIGLHALAALFHHVVLRDNTLRRMLPASRT